MCDIEKNYSLKVDELRKLMKLRRAFGAAMDLALELHTITHTGTVSSSEIPTFCDELLEGLTDEDYSILPESRI